MAKFQNSKFKNKVQNSKSSRIHPRARTRTRPLHGSMIAAPRLGGHKASPVVLVRSSLALWRCDDLAMRARAFNGDWRGLQGESEGKTFFHFPLKWGESVPIIQFHMKHVTKMNKQTISAGFLLLACGDVVALSQCTLSLWEAVAFGALCVTSYGMGLFAGLAE